MQNPLISIIVIGKNEAKNLSRLHTSLECIMSNWDCETIFVDSASRDNSIEIAIPLFDKIISLADSPYLNASAGRNVGVNMATGKWALFLDGDMEIIPDCITLLREYIEKLPDNFGVVGNYVHRLSGGFISRWKPAIDRYGRVIHFGGAVLLPIVALRKENWDPCLYSNEEIDLYSRLRSNGYHVCSLGTDFINHWTCSVPFLNKLFGNFYPNGSYLGKKFYGFGQLLAMRIKTGKLTNLIRWWPDPFALWAAIFLVPVINMFGDWYLSASFLIIVSIAIALRHTWKVIILYLAFLPQGLYGYRRLILNWTPTVHAVYVKRNYSSTISESNQFNKKIK